MRLVRKTDPYNTQTYVPIDKRIIVLFSADIAHHSIKDNVQLIELNTENFIEIDVVYSQRRMEITPKQPLRNDEKHMLILKGGEEGLFSIVGDYEAIDYKMEFTTRASAHIKAPTILNPIHETKYMEFPKIVLKTEEDENLDYYLVQISRTKSFNQILWSHKVRNIFSDKVELIPEMKDPIERLYIRAIGIDRVNNEASYSDVIQIYIKEAFSEEIDIPEDNEAPEENKEEYNIVQSMPQHKTYEVQPEEKNVIHLLFDVEIDPESVNTSNVYISKEEN